MTSQRLGSPQTYFSRVSGEGSWESAGSTIQAALESAHLGNAPLGQTCKWFNVLSPHPRSCPHTGFPKPLSRVVRPCVEEPHTVGAAEPPLVSNSRNPLGGRGHVRQRRSTGAREDLQGAPLPARVCCRGLPGRTQTAPAFPGEMRSPTRHVLELDTIPEQPGPQETGRSEHLAPMAHQNI